MVNKKKLKTKNKYANIPVLQDEFDTYGKLKMIAQANNRGLGDQVRAWVEASLPSDCGHAKVAVTVETFPNATHLHQKEIRKAWYCATCNRVYEFDMNEPVLETQKIRNQPESDPYGQVVPA